MLNANSNELAGFGVEAIGIFGSVARSENQAGSDIDILVRFRSGAKTFDNYMDLKFFLESVFESSKVDLVIEESVKPRLRDIIRREVVYAS